MYKRYRRRTITLLTIIAVIFISLSSFAVVRLLKNGRIGVNLNIYMDNSGPTNQKEDVEIFVSKLNSDLENGKVEMKDGTYEIESIDFSSTLFKPDLGWLNVSNNEVSEYSFYFFNSEEDATSDIDLTKYYSNCYVQKRNDQIIYEELTTNKVINVKDFGATGDISKHLANSEALETIQNPKIDPKDENSEEFELSDYQKAAILETNAIQKAVEEVNKTGGILYFPQGMYCVATNDFKLALGNKSIFTLQTQNHIIVELGMSTIKQISFSAPYNFPQVTLFMCKQSENIEIRNGTLIGDRREHDYSNWTFNDYVAGLDQDTHELIYGISFDWVRTARAYNLKITEFAGDAIIIKNNCVDNPDFRGYCTYVEDCELSYCRRQGISFLDSDENYVKNCLIHHIGHVDIYDSEGANKGTAPMCGIDIEPASGTQRVDLVEIEGTTIHSCSNYGIVSASKYTRRSDVVIKNSNIENPTISNTIFENSTLVFNDYVSSDGANAMTGSEYKNIIFKFKNKHKFSLFLENGIFDSCEFVSDTVKIIEGREENARIVFSTSKDKEYYEKIQAVDFKNLINLTFKNIKGFLNVDNNGNSYQTYGVHIDNGNLENCVLDNCLVNINNANVKDSKLTNSLLYTAYHTTKITIDSVVFNTCILDIKGGDTEVKDCKFYSCTVQFGWKAAGNFSSCILDNCQAIIDRTASTYFEKCIFNKCSGFPTVTQ